MAIEIIYYETGKVPSMKLHQNRLDRFSVIAKKLVDEHSAELFSESRLSDSDDIYNNHFQNLGKQLEEYAREFINSCKVQNDQLKNDIWYTCNKYLDLFASINQPGQLRHY